MRAIGVFVAVVACLAWSGAEASATPLVSGDGSGNASFVAAPGEENEVAFTHIQSAEGDNWSVTEAGEANPLAFAGSCRQAWSPAAAVCPAGGSLSIELGDAADILAHTGYGIYSGAERALPSHVIVSGGPGDDRLMFDADGGIWELEGGPGNDQILGATWQPEGTVFDAFPGTYRLSGGEGDDRITGFFDTVAAPLTGTTEIAEEFNGGPGNDTLGGVGGDDVMHGEDGNDVINGGPGNDLIEGGAGDDELIGEAGSDVLLGGEGDDLINAIDEPPLGDTIDCGPGTDRVLADSQDAVPLDCEEVGNLVFECPPGAVECAGTVVLQASPAGASASAASGRRRRPRSLGAGKFSLKGGKSGPAAARLLSRGRRIVRKHGRLRVRVRVTTTVHRRHGGVKVLRHTGTLVLSRR